MRLEPMPRDRRYLLMVPLAALVAVLPLLLHGCSCGHDFDFHLLNWIEAATQFSHGNLHPHWAFTPAFNAGEPRFVFYPPISWYLGAFLGMVLMHLPYVSEVATWNAVPVLFTWIALTASGFALYRLAREFVRPDAALIASALYLANPYMLFTAFERTAYAELLAAAWMPLLLLAILREKVTVPRVALPLALLWLTNAPAAVMGSYTLALLAALRLISNFRAGETSAPLIASEGRAAGRSAALSLALKTAGGTLLGLGLAAFYIVPAAYERRYVQIATAIMPGLRIQDNFLFEHTTGPDAADHDTVLRTASMVAVLLVAVTAAVLIANFIRRRMAVRAYAVPVFPLTFLAAGIGFLLIPWSLPIWSHVPQAAFLQFPWRLMAVLAVVLAVAVGGMLDGLRLGPWASGILGLAVAAGLAFPAYRVFGQRCFIEDQPGTRLALFHSSAGTDATDEYTPLGADNNALKASGPPYWLSDSAQAPAPLNVIPAAVAARFNISTPHAEFLIINLRAYPSWKIALDGTVNAQRIPRRDGLIALPVPAGASMVEIRYGQMFDQTLGDGITLLALALLLWLLYAGWMRQRTAAGLAGVLSEDAGRATKGTKLDVSAE